MELRQRNNSRLEVRNASDWVESLLHVQKVSTEQRLQKPVLQNNKFSILLSYFLQQTRRTYFILAHHNHFHGSKNPLLIIILNYMI